MKPANYYFYYLLITIFCISTTTYAQNFDETWKEFLENNKISNMSRLNKPDKNFKKLDYAKYLLMNTNSDFCQSKIDKSETLMAEIQGMNPQVHKAIPGYEKKLTDLETKIKAYHGIDVIWKRFLKTKEVNVEELEAVIPPSSICEKQTLVKYSYMSAHYYLCQGDISKSKHIFENRTLRIAEKTTLRTKDVEGLTSEVANMKFLYSNMSKLDLAWESYIATGVSPGFDIDLPLFSCYPIPNIKEFILKGLADVCYSGSTMFEKIKKLQADSGVVLDRELKEKLKELEAAVEEKESNLSDLNKAWEAFLPDNKVKHFGNYAYEYCSKEPLIRAYIMDGFAFLCELGEETFLRIDTLQKSNPVRLDKTTKTKIKELEELIQQYKFNGVKIDEIWEDFVADGDILSEDYLSSDQYCDNIQEIKDWTMRGLSSSCVDGIPYLEKIEAFTRTSEFKFYKDLECRVQKLRIKIWDCRYQVLQDLVQFEAGTDAYKERLAELMKENSMGERPEVCSLDK